METKLRFPVMAWSSQDKLEALNGLLIYRNAPIRQRGCFQFKYPVLTLCHQMLPVTGLQVSKLLLRILSIFGRRNQQISYGGHHLQMAQFNGQPSPKAAIRRILP